MFGVVGLSYLASPCSVFFAMGLPLVRSLPGLGWLSSLTCAREIFYVLLRLVLAWDGGILSALSCENWNCCSVKSQVFPFL